MGDIREPGLGVDDHLEVVVAGTSTPMADHMLAAAHR
jgi:hypothetical protein